jgi:anaphase-promoting complex subunit 2
VSGLLLDYTWGLAQRAIEFRTNKPSDIISTLVSIYDSQDLFVKELQVLLAQRLLAITKAGIDRVEREVNMFPQPRSSSLVCSRDTQRRNIEILKIRFGEAALQVCEVMLRDMTDSKRIDQHVQSQKKVSPLNHRRLNSVTEKRNMQSVLHPTIISRAFWPSLESSDMVMPGQFQKYEAPFLLSERVPDTFISQGYLKTMLGNSRYSNPTRGSSGCPI